MPDQLSQSHAANKRHCTQGPESPGCGQSTRGLDPLCDSLAEVQGAEAWEEPSLSPGALGPPSA